MPAVLDQHQTVLEHISWNTYLALLHDAGDKRSSRFAYQNGRLEIARPSELHERIKHVLERIITTLTLMYNLPVKGFGSTTLNREDLNQGAEPDACYYIQQVHVIQGKDLDLSIEAVPAPDLVVEVDSYHASDLKMSIYAQMGVLELWRYQKGSVSIYHLEQQKFALKTQSLTFPNVTTELLNSWLQQADEQDDNAVAHSVMDWAKE